MLDKLKISNGKDTDLNGQNSLKQKIDEKLSTLLNDSKIKKYRKDWEKNIKFVDDNTKKRIIEVSKKIPVDIKNIDGNTIFEINLGEETYKIKTINTKKYADKYHAWRGVSKGESIDKEEIHAHQIRGNNPDDWENKKLANYIKIQEENGFFRPSEELTKDILGKLGEKADLNKESDEIAMLMYLIGIKGDYRLLQDEGKDYISQLECSFDGRRTTGGYCGGMAQGKIILISKN